MYGLQQRSDLDQMDVEDKRRSVSSTTDSLRVKRKTRANHTAAHLMRLLVGLGPSGAAALPTPEANRIFPDLHSKVIAAQA